MTLQVINNGSRANDETAETLFSAFEKVKSNFSELYGIYGSEVEAFTFTTKQNDLALAAGTRIVRWNGAGTTGITGIVLSAGQQVTIVNASTDYLLWLENESTASAAGNRIMGPDGFPMFLMPGDCITLWKDGTTNRVRVLSWPTRGKAMGLTDFDDFAGGNFGVYTNTNNSGTTGAQYAGSAKAFGVAGVNTSTSASSRPTIGGATAMSLGSAAVLTVSRARCGTALPDGTETYTGIVGLSSVTNDAHVNAIAWELRWNGASAEWAQSCVSASVATRSTASSPSPVLSAWIWLAVFVNAAGSRADFIYSTDGVAFVLSGSASSGLPSTSVQISPVAIAAMKTAGTTARIMHADIAGFRFVTPTARAT